MSQSLNQQTEIKITTSSDLAKRCARYQAHLDQVSRSFAFAISRLELPLRAPVGLSYLICRLLDTIEDAPWTSSASQSASFESFNSFIERLPHEGKIEAWASQLPENLPDGERALLNDATSILKDFHSSPEAEKSVIRPAVLSMSAGMAHFMERKSREGSLKLKTINEVDRYCFFVAGLVGEVLTGLVRVNAPALGLKSQDVAALSLSDGLHFGLFLQKVNLLKDQRTDESEGRFLIPDRALVFSTLKNEADAAFRYLMQIPEQLKGYRLFSSYSFFLGLASLPWIERSYAADAKLKIPRVEAGLLFARIELKIANDEKLLQEYRELAATAFSGLAAFETPLVVAGEGSLAHLYKGLLSTSEIPAFL